MYVIKNKIFLISIISLVGTNIDALEKKITELSVGDIININNLNFKSIEIYGDIFNGTKTAYLIEVKDLVGIKQITVEKKICLPFESLASYYYPEIKIDNKKFNLSKILNDTNQNIYFHINPDLIDNVYSYGIVKVCRIWKKQKLIIDVLDKDNFPIVNSYINYKLMLDKTAVLRFKQENETHYISSISTGECLLQVYVNEAEFCSQELIKKSISNDDIENFIKSSNYKSRVKTTNSNKDRENKINTYLNNFGKSIYQLSNIKLDKSIYDLFEPFTNNDVLELNLRTLPDLPKELPSLTNIHEKFFKDIVPGDIINVKDLMNINSIIVYNNILVDLYDQTTTPFIHLNYTDCHAFNKNDAVKIKVAPYEIYPNYYTDYYYYYKFDVFDKIIKQKNYGVDPQYLNKNYKCLKIKICSEFERSKLIIPSVYVVNLNKNTANKFTMFDSQNVILRYALGNETHYVARTEKGNCLFQALIYENLDNSTDNRYVQNPLLYKGKILSANNDHDLEKWAEESLDKLSTNNHKTLMELTYNRTYEASIYARLSLKNSLHTVINMYLNKLN